MESILLPEPTKIKHGEGLKECLCSCPKVLILNKALHSAKICIPLKHRPSHWDSHKGQLPIPDWLSLLLPTFPNRTVVFSIPVSGGC